jgi:glycosyltransferase involved in cell wall biosynthesis
MLVDLLGECEARGAFAAHYAAWLRRRGLRDALYLRTPVPDPLGDGWQAERDRRLAARPRLLLVGHLKGVVTLEGLWTFARRILPRLERELGPDGFEARILGGYDPPPELARALDRPSVALLGHREDPAAEFLSAHVLLAPNSIPLGIRVRIVSAFSFGCCVVTHAANALGIPELEHGRNALVGRSPDALAEATLQAIRDAGLRRRLEAAGRETYERSFAPGPAVGRIEAVLHSIAGPPARLLAR